MPYFGHQGQSGNEATRQLSGLPVHLGYRGYSEPTGEVQAKLYETIKNAASRCFLGILLFKVSEWIFSWHWNLQLHLETKPPKYQIFDAFRGKYLSLSKKFHLVFPWNIHEKNLEDLFVGVVHCSVGTKKWHVPQYFCHKERVATNHTSHVMVNITFPVMDEVVNLCKPTMNEGIHKLTKKKY